MNTCDVKAVGWFRNLVFRGLASGIACGDVGTAAHRDSATTGGD